MFLKDVCELTTGVDLGLATAIMWSLDLVCDAECEGGTRNAMFAALQAVTEADNMQVGDYITLVGNDVAVALDTRKRGGHQTSPVTAMRSYNRMLNGCTDYPNAWAISIERWSDCYVVVAFIDHEETNGVL